MLDRFKSFLSALQTKAVPLSSPAALDIFGVPPATSGIPVDALAALKVPAAAQGVKLISEAVATLDWRLCRESPDGRQEIEVGDHPVARLLERPSPWLGETELKRQVVQDMLLHGNGMLLVSRVRGEPRELHRVDPRSCSIIVDQITGEPRYSIALQEGGTQEFGYSDVIHLRGPTLDGVRGMGLTALGAEALGLAIILERHAAGLFARGARPGGILELPGKATTELLARLRESFASIYGGTQGAGRTAVLESGVKFTALQLSSVDAQFLQLKEHMVLEIARLLNIAPTMLGDLRAGSFANVELLSQMFLDRTLVPVLELFEDQLERVLLTEDERDAGFEIEFDTSNFVRADAEKRFAAYKSGIESGTLLINEARNLEGLKPVPGGEIPARSVQVVPINSDGSTPAPTPQDQQQ